MSRLLAIVFALATSITFAQTNCNCYAVRTNPDTPPLALRLWNLEKVNDENVVSFFPQLYSESEETRVFYFQVITNAMTVSDGATSEGLGYEAAALVQNDLAHFTSFFTTNGCFDPIDIRTWAFCVFTEVQIESDPSSIRREVKSLQRSIKKNARKLPKEDRVVAALFNDYLEIAVQTR
jgi:hypothetical protein